MMFDHALVDWINIIFLRLQTIVYMYFIFIVKVVLHLLVCCQEEITMAAKLGNKICSLHFCGETANKTLTNIIFHLAQYLFTHYNMLQEPLLFNGVYCIPFYFGSEIFSRILCFSALLQKLIL